MWWGACVTPGGDGKEATGGAWSRGMSPETPIDHWREEEAGTAWGTAGDDVMTIDARGEAEEDASR